MIGFIRDRVDAFFGRGKYNITVPVMDGPLEPNQKLEEAPVIASAEGLDNLMSVGGAIYFSSGSTLLRLTAGYEVPQTISTFSAPIACLAADEQGNMAIGLDGDGIVIRGGSHDGVEVKAIGDKRLICPTSALFLDKNTLIVASGSSFYNATQWKHDLMSLGRSGSIWRIDLITGHSKSLAAGLSFPYGLGDAGDGGLFVTEAWRHRIVYVHEQNNKGLKILLDELPGYPARLAPASHGGWWLGMLAARNQLFEFVLTERNYRKKMMANIDPEYWIAPALTSGASFKEPLQGGSVKQLGILKPWAPPRSYGLVVLLGKNMQPLNSWHSRADGKMHGATSLCEHEGRLIVGVKGPGHALALNGLNEISKEGSHGSDS